jgi:hypothetical protein
VDGAGARRTVTGATTIVGATPNVTLVESVQQGDFPTVVLEVPRETTPNQQVTARAIAPSARIELERPATLPDLQPGDTLLLVRPIEIGGQARLELLDRLSRVDGAIPVLRTSGRELPGITSGGDLAIVAAREPMAFVSGRANGPAAAVVADDLPFVVTTAGANGRFILPVPASQPFTLRILGLDGTPRTPTPTPSSISPHQWSSASPSRSKRGVWPRRLSCSTTAAAGCSAP